MQPDLAEGKQNGKGLVKFLIANTDYSQFLNELYARQPGLSEQSFAEQLRIRYATRFGVADFYSRNLRAVGHEALDVYVNNIAMQRVWVKEFGAMKSQKRAAFDRLIDRLWQETDRPIIRHARPLMRSWFGQDDEGCRILAAQVEQHRPDVFLNQAMDGIDSRWLKGIKPRVRLLVGQHAATSLPDHGDYSCYDLVVSSFPPTVEFFQRKGIPAVLHRLGFDPEVLLPKAEQERSYPVTFVGSLSAVHRSRIEWLEQLCVLVPELRIWGPGADLLDTASPLRGRHMGVVWGNEMYDILLRSQITLNHHGDVAPYANNCRLFEATGAGAMLLTDWKANLQDLFDVGREVAAYRTVEDCAQMIRHYLDHEDDRRTMARAGQTRTFRDHTYRIRMQELVEIVHKRMAA
jgi:spore maturation protein CgeB